MISTKVLTAILTGDALLGLRPRKAVPKFRGWN